MEDISDDEEKSFRPCKCNYCVHHKCLSKWVDTIKTESCEICYTNYNISHRTVPKLPDCCSRTINCCCVNKSVIFLILLCILVPFFGDNGSNLVTYQYSVIEEDCAGDNWQSFPRFLSILNPPAIMIIICIIFFAVGEIDSWSFCQTKWQIIINKINTIRLSALIILWHAIFYIIGNIITYYLQPIGYQGGDSYGSSCSDYNQLDIDRYMWLKPVNISLVTWFFGITAISFVIDTIVAGCIFCVGIFYCFRGIGLLFHSMILRCRRLGCLKACCPCFCKDVMVINTLPYAF